MWKLRLALMLPVIGANSGVLAADNGASISAQRVSFKLFGTSFCFIESQPATGCDVQLHALPWTQRPDVRPHEQRWRLFGLRVCTTLTASGAACDLIWNPPSPAVAWRDFPEVRFGLP